MAKKPRVIASRWTRHEYLCILAGLRTEQAMLLGSDSPEHERRALFLQAMIKKTVCRILAFQKPARRSGKRVPACS